MKFGYARCSTADKQDIARQIRDLKAAGAQEVYEERASGASPNRTVLDTLLAKLSHGDTICVTEVSRLTRDTGQMVEILSHLEKNQIRLECGSIVADYTATVDTMQRAMLLIMAVFAELERGMTVERIKSGLQNARAEGAKIGRPKTTVEDIPDIVRDLLPRYMAGEFRKAEYARLAGVSRNTLYKYLALLGVDAPDVPCVTRGNQTRRKGNQGRPKTTVADIPATVRQLYPDYVAGNLRKFDYAKLAGVSRTTLDKYLALLASGVEK
jgi:DNA invertase Pin-like site-specific DNA recombinase